MNNQKPHKSVLLNEVLQALNPQDGEVIIDGTFGAGGYTKAILEKAKTKVIAFDRDKSAERFVPEIKEKFGTRFEFINSPFSKMRERVSEKVDGIVLDLGVSSMQLDEEIRGFSFAGQVRLDMRMDQSEGISAYEVVNEFSESELAKIIYEFGEDHKSRQIAKRIVETRAKKPIETGLELAEIVKKVYGFQSGKIHPATKTFQGIRIFVNDELGELERVLEVSKEMLKEGGRLVIVSFHSLEDGMVKEFLRRMSGYFDRSGSRYDPVTTGEINKKYNFYLPKSSSIKPSDEEIKENIRSRSARLRLAIKN